jgi:hypothetical protein
MQLVTHEETSMTLLVYFSIETLQTGEWDDKFKTLKEKKAIIQK